MLYPFKYKKALQPLADSLDVLVALDTSVYFSTGNYDSAVKAGLTNMGYPSTTLYRNVDTDTYQLITHEVMPKGNALTCTQCHTSTATQMNLKGMGYAMKGTQSTTCTQCHGSESIPSYTSLHNRHVTRQKIRLFLVPQFLAAGTRPENALRVGIRYNSAQRDGVRHSINFQLADSGDNVLDRHGYCRCDRLSADRNCNETFSNSIRMDIWQTRELYICNRWRQNPVCLGQGCGRKCFQQSRTGTVTITLSGPSDTIAPTVSAFSIPSTSSYAYGCDYNI